MGNKLSYCERRCQICAVSFRVRRIPTPEERGAQAVQARDGPGYDGRIISAEEMKVGAVDRFFIVLWTV